MEVWDEETKRQWREFVRRREAARDLTYLQDFAELALEPRDPLIVTCPRCGTVFWIRMPEKRPDFCYEGHPRLCCPEACGHGGNLTAFRPRPAHPDAELDFDIRQACRCGCAFACDGVVVRRPCCAIETPREVMSDIASKVREALQSSEQPPSRAILESNLARLVATFDGVMRQMVRIKNNNTAALIDGGEPLPQYPWSRPLPPAISFQNLEGARRKLAAVGWDMGTHHKWHALVTLFHKRHLCVHTLGVVDKRYLDATGDTEARLGK
jgi:hypothetical protein